MLAEKLTRPMRPSIRRNFFGDGYPNMEADGEKGMGCLLVGYTVGIMALIATVGILATHPDIQIHLPIPTPIPTPSPMPFLRGIRAM